MKTDHDRNLVIWLLIGIVVAVFWWVLSRSLPMSAMERGYWQRGAFEILVGLLGLVILVNLCKIRRLRRDLEDMKRRLSEMPKATEEQSDKGSANDGGGEAAD